MNIGIVSGYFNPLHLGHIQYIEAAHNRCDHLVVIVNNDEQVKLKGSKQFMDQEHRCKIVKALRAVDGVILSIDKTKTVCETITLVRTSMPAHNMSFFNSGDRVGNNAASAEVILCKRLKIKYVELPLLKLYSSSELLKHL
jgi:cytidyltransferase-like protein